MRGFALRRSDGRVTATGCAGPSTATGLAGVTTVLRVAGITALATMAACGGDEAPAMTVGPVAYSDSDLLGLSESRRELLAALTSVGLALSDSTVVELGAPVLEERLEDRLIEVLAADLTLEAAGVGDAVLEARYETDPRWELVVHHLLVYSERWRSDEHRAAASAKAGRAREMLLGGSSFEDTEAALAQEPGAEVGQGRMPPGREGTWVPEFWRAALALQPGELSPVTETQYGFHVIRQEERSPVPFAEARNAVSEEVARQIGSPDAALRAWMEGVGGDEDARRSAALAEAEARGLSVSPAGRVEIEREWLEEVQQWAFALGFSYGLAPEQVGRAALAALGSGAQNTDIARRAIEAHGDALLSRYPVSTGTP